MFDRDGAEYGTMTSTAQGVILQVEDTSGACQLKAGETYDKDGNDKDILIQSSTATLTQHYGFSSYPAKNTEVVTNILKSGDVAVVAENPTRPSLSEGESKMWAAQGQYVYLKSDGSLHMGPASSAHTTAIFGRLLVGSLAAAEAWLKGTTVVTAMSAWFGALNTFFGSWNTELGNLSGSSDPAVQNYGSNMQTALGILNTALGAVTGTLTAWPSVKHYLDS